MQAQATYAFFRAADARLTRPAPSHCAASVCVTSAASVSTSHAEPQNRVVRGAEQAPDDGLRELPPRFKTMLVKNLQKELEARGERTTGKKSVLLKRMAVRAS